MISRILDLLFIHSLRAWAREDARRTPGWLTAAADPLVGRAIAAMHRDPAHARSVPELARIATLSRSTFAERFRVLLGTPPATYLAEARLQRAAELPRATTEPVGTVARGVGYTSESARRSQGHQVRALTAPSLLVGVSGLGLGGPIGVRGPAVAGCTHR